MAKPDQTIFDRIINAMNSRGRTESWREFCTKIGVSPTYLSMLKRVCEEHPERSIDVDTAGRFARELGMSIEQLVGHPDVVTDDPYPSRVNAVAAARALQLSQSAIDAAYREDPGVDPGELWWFRRMEAEEARLKLGPALQRVRPVAQRSRSSYRPSKS